MLSQASREEVQAIKPKLLQADSKLLLGLSSYFRGLAEIEAVDFDEPNALSLRGSIPHLVEARKHLASSVEAGTAALGLVRRMTNSNGFQARLTAVSADVTALNAAIDALSQSVADGGYPTSKVCANAAAAVLRVVTPMERNALVELGAHELGN